MRIDPRLNPQMGNALPDHRVGAVFATCSLVRAPPSAPVHHFRLGSEPMSKISIVGFALTLPKGIGAMLNFFPRCAVGRVQAGVRIAGRGRGFGRVSVDPRHFEI